MRKYIRFITDWIYTEGLPSSGKVAEARINLVEIKHKFQSILQDSPPNFGQLSSVASDTYPITPPMFIHNHVPTDVARDIVREVINRGSTNIKAAIMVTINESTGKSEAQFISKEFERSSTLDSAVFDACFYGTQLRHLKNISNAMQDSGEIPSNFWMADKPNTSDLVSGYHFTVENVVNGLMDDIDLVANTKTIDPYFRKQVYEALIHRLVNNLNK